MQIPQQWAKHGRNGGEGLAATAPSMHGDVFIAGLYQKSDTLHLNLSDFSNVQTTFSANILYICKRKQAVVFKI